MRSALQFTSNLTQQTFPIASWCPHSYGPRNIPPYRDAGGLRLLFLFWQIGDRLHERRPHYTLYCMVPNLLAHRCHRVVLDWILLTGALRGRRGLRVFLVAWTSMFCLCFHI